MAGPWGVVRTAADAGRLEGLWDTESDHREGGPQTGPAVGLDLRSGPATGSSPPGGGRQSRDTAGSPPLRARACPGYNRRMRTFSLQSGSNGNSIYVEALDTRILIDAGISGACAQRRMAAHGRNIRDVQALIVTHDHSDHISAAGTYNRKFGIPIHITRKTQQAYRPGLGKVRGVRHFVAGESLSIGNLTIHTVQTPHDAADGVAIIVEAEGRRLGVLTDLGNPFAGLQELLESVDAAYLESNYDPIMLEHGPYPIGLKERIRGGAGHLSNHEAAELVRRCRRKRPNWVAIAHLSAENNEPHLAIDAHHQAVGRDYPIHHASRHDVSPVWDV